VQKIGLRNRRTRLGICVATAGLLAVGIPTIVRHSGASDDHASGSIELTTASGFTFTRPARSGGPLGVYPRKDGLWYAGVVGTTSGTVAPTATDAGHPSTTPTTTPSATPTTVPTGTASPSPTGSALPTTSVNPTPTATLPVPDGVFPAGTAHSFAAPVDLTGYAGLVDDDALIQVTDGTTTATVAATLYEQTVTNVRAVSSQLTGTANVTITATVTDQYGLPVVGAPLRLDGTIAGGPRVDQLAVSNALGQVTFTGPGTDSGPTPATGYPTGGYRVYADLNVNDNQGSKEPGYQVINGTVTFAAPGKAFYHSDKRIKNAGGVYADAAKGTKAAHAKGYSWIDQDGQLVFRSRPQKLAGAARVSQASELVWVNAHGSPFNPKWLKKGRFETKTWDAIKNRPGLRDAAKTLKQNARYGLSVEWEVKDVKPFTKAATLDAAFANLAALARQYYGDSWSSKVEIKVLSNLSGGQKYALKVLKRAHAYGFTTMFLARGKATATQIPATAQPYVTYVRGAGSGVYPAIPSPAQDAPVVVTTPRVS
jgi:hypothetical protein